MLAPTASLFDQTALTDRAERLVKAALAHGADAADAVVRAAAMLNDSGPINIGTGCEISICELSELIAKFTGFPGQINWDINRADGQPRRMIDTQKAKKLLGWAASTSFDEGLKRTIAWWREQQPHGHQSKGYRSSCIPTPAAKRA